MPVCITEKVTAWKNVNNCPKGRFSSMQWHDNAHLRPPVQLAQGFISIAPHHHDIYLWWCPVRQSACIVGRQGSGIDDVRPESSAA